MTPPARTALQKAIAAYLLRAGGWVSAATLAAVFGVDKRKFRQANGKPGLCTECAISNSKKGYRHILCATDDEFLHHYRDKRKHAIGEMVRVRNQFTERMEARRRQEERARIEGESGQRIMNLDAFVERVRDAWTPDEVLKGRSEQPARAGEEE